MHDLKDDIIGPGARRIADATGESPRRVLHLVEAHNLPVILRGGKLYSRRSWLDAWYSGREIPDAPPPYVPKPRARGKPRAKHKAAALELNDGASIVICTRCGTRRPPTRGRRPRAWVCPDCREG